MMRALLSPVAMLSALVVLAQAGSVDLSFAPQDFTGGNDHGLNGSCRTILVQPDGKVLVGGDFTHCNGVERGRIARMNADGSLDPTFDPGYGANGSVRTMALQADGGIIIGGSFTYVNGVPCNRIARLTSEGAVDEGFDPGNGFNHDVLALAVQADGRILAGGDFGSCNGESGNRIARLDADGGRDASFELEEGVLDAVNVIVPMPGGDIIIGGAFSSIEDHARNGIARLHADGGLDESFAPEGWYGGLVRTVALLPTGQLVVGGILPGSLARLNADGSTDDSFMSSGVGFTGWDPWVYAVQPDAQGRLLVAGRFTHYNGAAVNGIARLNPDGSLDGQFMSGEGFNSDVFAMAVQPDGKVLTGGFFDSVDGTPRNRVARLIGEDLSTAYADLTDGGFSVHPNPSVGPLTINADLAAPASIIITDLQGRSVSQDRLAAGIGTRHSVDLGQQPKGVYVVRIASGDQVRTRRVVIN